MADPIGKFAPTGTVVAYDAISGAKLFTMESVVTRLTDQTPALPQANQTLEYAKKQYRIVGVRKGSTEKRCEIDVREE